MNGLLAYPPSAPRLVTNAEGRSRAGTYLAAASAIARARWWLAARRCVGRWLWRSPAREVVLAWEIGTSLLDQPRQAIVGILGEPGPEQRLVLVPAEERIVVKVAVRASGDALIERERVCLARLQKTAWCHLGPRLRDGSRLPARTARAVLVMDRVDGTHPSWDDRSVHRELLRALSAPAGRDNPGENPLVEASTGLHHGDVTPWNVIRQDDGTLVILDWELAQLSTNAHPLCGVLDFILRGAVVARARAARVAPVVRAALGCAGAATPEPRELVATYRAYRLRVQRDTGDRPNALTISADRILATCLPEAVAR